MTPIPYMDELQWMEHRRTILQRRINRSRKRMKQTYDSLTQQDPMPADRWGKLAYWLSRSGTILRGLRTGYHLATTFDALLRIRRFMGKRSKK